MDLIRLENYIQAKLFKFTKTHILTKVFNDNIVGYSVLKTKFKIKRLCFSLDCISLFFCGPPLGTLMLNPHTILEQFQLFYGKRRYRCYNGWADSDVNEEGKLWFEKKNENKN